MNRKLNKNLLIITRVVMFCLGATIGAISMWQFLTAFPDKVHENLNIVFYIASGLFAAFLLFFSAKPILYLIMAAGEAIKKLFKRTRPLEIAGIFLGLAIGIMFAYLVEALLSLVLGLIGVRIIISIIVGLVSSYVAALICVRVLSSGVETDTIENGGYLISSGALKNSKIIDLCTNWLIGAIVVLPMSVDKLNGQLASDETEDNDAKSGLVNYYKLTELNRLKCAQFKSNKEEDESLNIYANYKGLKIICLSSETGIDEQRALKIDTLQKID